MTDDPLRQPEPDRPDLPESQPFAPPEPEPAGGASAGEAPAADVPPPASGDDAPTVAYSPPPERRPDWASPSWKHAATTGLDAPSPALSAVPPATPVVRNTRSGTGLGTILAASLLSAVLASGGTYALLQS